MSLPNDHTVGTGHAPRLRMPAALLDALRDGLPDLAERTVTTVVAEVPAYTNTVGAERRMIEGAVRQTVTVFVRLITDGFDPDTSPAQDPALAGAYGLGQGEARAGRGSDVLLAAYRVGARTVWREWSDLAVNHELAGDQLAVFAEQIFAYMDRLSAASVSGHTDEEARTGRARQRARELLVRRLLGAASPEELAVTAERADWAPPRTLTAVAVPGGWGVSEAKVIDQRTLEIPEDAVAPLARPASLLLVPDVGGSARAGYVEAFPVTGSVIGPARPWMQAAVSVRRVERTLAMDIADDRVTDTERHLPELVLGADAQALCDLRARALQPLLAMRPHMRDNLLATLRAWLLHQGSRDAIAAELFVHPQTVRYRMSRLREVYGERLDDPRTVLELTLALGIPRFDGGSSG